MPPASAAPEHPVSGTTADVAATPPATAAPTSEPEAMEEDSRPVVTAAAAATLTAAIAPITASAGWPGPAAAATDAAASVPKPPGFSTGRTTPGSKATSRVQQRRTRGRGPQGSGTAAPDLNWVPESLEGVGESSDPAEAQQDTKRHSTTGGSSGRGRAAAPAPASAAEDQDRVADGEVTAAPEPPPNAVMAKATAAGARARQQQQQHTEAQQHGWHQQQWQMRDGRISAGSSTTCNICASESGGTSSSGSVTGPFAGGGGDEAESKARGAAAAAGLQRLGISSRPTAVRSSAAAHDSAV